MQIMDSYVTEMAVECETKVPSAPSPDLAKPAEDQKPPASSVSVPTAASAAAGNDSDPVELIDEDEEDEEEDLESPQSQQKPRESPAETPREEPASSSPPPAKIEQNGVAAKTPEATIEDLPDDESDASPPKREEVKEKTPPPRPAKGSGQKAPTEEQAVDLSAPNETPKEPVPKEKSPVPVAAPPVVEQPKDLSAAIKQEVVEESRKRSRSQSPEAVQEQRSGSPNKRLKTELDSSYTSHDRLLRDYIERSQNRTQEELARNIDNIQTEIATLDEMLVAKEQEWNNMLRLKKVKEELLERMKRKRSVLELGADYKPEEAAAEPKISVSFNNSLLFTAAAASSTPNGSNTGSARNSRNASLKDSLAHNSVTMVPLISSTPGPQVTTSAQSILASRANMKRADLLKENQNVAKLQRNILPRPPTLPNHEQILRNLAMSSGTSAAALFQPGGATTITDLLNGHGGAAGVGRQGVIKDVKSIIADFREKHPEQIPRRGRRMKGGPLDAGNSRPSSADSSHSNSNHSTTAAATAFKDILAQFEKMTPAERLKSSNSIISAITMSAQQQQMAAAQAVAAAQNAAQKPPPYPEVSLLPVMNSDNGGGGASGNATGNGGQQNSGTSLLHGILTKSSSRSTSAANTNNTSTAAANAAMAASGFTSFSPTLARLLTAPERISPHAQNIANYQAAAAAAAAAASNPLASLSAGLNLSKPNSEITITPVVNQAALQQALLAQQQAAAAAAAAQQRAAAAKEKQKQRAAAFAAFEDDDESADRLVIDEGDGHDAGGGGVGAGREFQENEVPECQGCKKREAQFVCAGCGNQWYCSRDCQVAAWDEHSETCTG